VKTFIVGGSHCHDNFINQKKFDKCYKVILLQQSPVEKLDFY